MCHILPMSVNRWKSRARLKAAPVLLLVTVDPIERDIWDEDADTARTRACHRRRTIWQVGWVSCLVALSWPRVVTARTGLHRKRVAACRIFQGSVFQTSRGFSNTFAQKMNNIEVSEESVINTDKWS